MKKFLSKILVLFFVWNSNSFAEQKCSDFIDFEWYYSEFYSSNSAVFNFKSKSNKDIIIREVRLWTGDKDNVVAENRNLDLKSFRVLDTRIMLKDVNLSVIKYGEYVCSFKNEGGKLGGGAYKTKFEGYLFDTKKNEIFDNKKGEKGTFKNILGKYFGK